MPPASGCCAGDRSGVRQWRVAPFEPPNGIRPEVMPFLEAPSGGHDEVERAALPTGDRSHDRA
jgi:hypothetical protein